MFTEADMFERCMRCEGSRVDPKPPTDEPFDFNPCDRCSGTGQILTDQGMAVAAVIRHCARPLAWEQRAQRRLFGVRQ